jgi:uncharacterized protein (DUF4415 family)
MNANNMVSFELNPSNPPVTTQDQQTRLMALATMSDAQIDYSDIPRTSKNVVWHRVSALAPTDNKQQITLRLDADILNYFKSTGKRYQSRINAALRDYVGMRGARIGLTSTAG